MNTSPVQSRRGSNPRSSHSTGDQKTAEVKTWSGTGLGADSALGQRGCSAPAAKFVRGSSHKFDNRLKSVKLAPANAFRLFNRFHSDSRLTLFREELNGFPVLSQCSTLALGWSPSSRCRLVRKILQNSSLRTLQNFTEISNFWGIEEKFI